MTPAAITWVGGILFTIILGLIGTVWKSSIKKLDEMDEKVDDYAPRIATLETKMANVEKNADTHGQEIRGLAASLARLSDSVSALGQSMATMDERAEQRAKSLDERFESLAEVIAGRIEVAVLRLGTSLKEETREQLDKHMTTYKHT